MFGLLRLAIIAFVVLSIIYVSLSLYSRAVRRGKLEDEWDASKGPLEAFVAEGMQEYDGSLRKKLILGVYIVPTFLVALIIYLTNFA
ncbi:MAG: hypothetical protein ABJQ34_02525 [Paracoccaceae bacterium]